MTLGMIPFTVVWIFPINYRLIEISHQPVNQEEPTTKSAKAEVSRLLRRWATLNWCRSMIPLAASCVALAARF